MVCKLNLNKLYFKNEIRPLVWKVRPNLANQMFCWTISIN